MCLLFEKIEQQTKQLFCKLFLLHTFQDATYLYLSKSILNFSQRLAFAQNFSIPVNYRLSNHELGFCYQLIFRLYSCLVDDDDADVDDDNDDDDENDDDDNDNDVVLRCKNHVWFLYGNVICTV